MSVTLIYCVKMGKWIELFFGIRLPLVYPVLWAENNSAKALTHAHIQNHLMVLCLWHPSFYNFLRLLQSIAFSVFNLHAWQSFSTTSLQVLFGLPLGLEPSTSYSIHFFQSLSSFLNTCPNHHNLFCYSTEIMSSIPNLSLCSLLGNILP